MNCPVCPDTALVMTERSGVEIDYCPTCRGVWLDRGELDKIIDRAAAVSPAGPAPAAAPAAMAPPGPGAAAPPPPSRGYYGSPDSPDSYGHRGGYGHPKSRRKSFLGEIFDF